MTLSEIMERARKAQQEHEQKHDVQLEISSVRTDWCLNCKRQTTQERPNILTDEWRCYGCGMYLVTTNG